MTIDQVLGELKSLGTEQNRRIYKRHGVSDNMYGVSFANLGKIQKKIKFDHELAKQLWATGNHEARLLATMIADPSLADDGLLETWAKDLDNYVIADAFSKFAGATTLARKKTDKWTKSKNEWIGAAGWNMAGMLAMRDSELPDGYFESYLSVIEKEIHKSKNRVRYSMNNALIAIGMRNLEMRRRALAAAKRIGAVEVDHGETGCKTPDAVEYIGRIARRARKAT
ncbi:MAG TPA: DNA alkylation repair protein [Blastocatellia bacterium]|jgi:3-methyladenine DNA glycosylase AlkD